jgi:mitogen-activated protein kinase kinase kinase ANP1
MAPEVILGSNYSYTADIWSLGCSVLEMLTGKPPYHQLDAAAALFTIATQEEDPPFPSSISPEAHDFLRRCFIRDSKLRPDASSLLSHPFVNPNDIT